MKHSESDILKALNVIKETCEEYTNHVGACDYECPFIVSGDCVINELLPTNWTIVKRNTFKAFN